jgi:hypothetical protein
MLPTAQGPTVLAGKNYTGNPTLSGINRQYKNIGDGMFGSLSPGFPDMHAWLQRGLGMVRVADVNGDGKEEIIYTLNGHWNELRVYDNSQKPLWMKSFGPDKLGTGLMKGLAVIDIHSDGKMGIVVGTKTGWVIAFDHAGILLWQQNFPSSVTSMASNAARSVVVVGCEDGTVALLDVSGIRLNNGRVRGPVNQVAFAADGVLVGSSTGHVVKFPFKP